jgi:hypothetical protein
MTRPLSIDLRERGRTVIITFARIAMVAARRLVLRAGCRATVAKRTHFSRSSDATSYVRGA